MSHSRLKAVFILIAALTATSVPAQVPASGEITVQLVQGLDSATNPRGMSQGVVMKSSNPAIASGSTVMVGLGSDPINGGYTAKLVAIVINGQPTPAASSAVVLTPNLLNKFGPFVQRGQTQSAVSGTHVFLPTKTRIDLTLTEPPAQAAGPAAQARSDGQPDQPGPARSAGPPSRPSRRPAANAVDLPPAIPGAPALHASREAFPGCRWEAFALKNFGIELPVQRCDNPVENSTYEETATGLNYKHGRQETAVAFTVFSKPATQPIEAAIKAQFLKSTGDRTSCSVKNFGSMGSFQSYGIVAAPHSKITCIGITGANEENPSEGTTFFFNPADSQTKYIRFIGEAVVAYPFDLQALRFVESQDANAGQSAAGASPPAETRGTAPSGSASPSEGPPGPVAPVNRLNVRGISVRMGRGQIIAAAKAAGMLINSNTAQELKLIDPTVSVPMGTRAYGLILTVSLKNDTAVSVNVGEQGAERDEVLQDLIKKWGKPPHLPAGYDNELGTTDKASWGDKKTVYAEYNPSLYGYGGRTVTIYDAVALAPHPEVRKGVAM